MRYEQKIKKRENLKHFEGYMLVMINKTMGEPLWGDILLWIENILYIFLNQILTIKRLIYKYIYHICLRERITTYVNILRKTVALCISKAFIRMYVKDI